MKKWLTLTITCLAFFVMVACGNNEQEETKSESTIQMIETEINFPEKINVNEEVTISATVTQGEEAIEDADDVIFEIWLGEEKANSNKVEATHQGKGVYSIDYTFTEAGEYNVQAHTQAREMHVMPTEVVQVGEMGMGNSGVAKGEHDHLGATMIHFMAPDSIQADEETEIMAHIEKDGQPIEEANVQFEISQSGSDDTKLVEAEEIEPGKYSAPYIFDKGMHMVKITVKTDDLDETTEEMVMVE
ncbi:FixH family protein [Bacillus carboniphilus]|uniref:FixH family protein n=1 Tax=Bacillus carboniphilus TaxID=86663 RepID=A0ABY9JW81_9BACI|nr:FixH family protein [Bacillus carboniphilus]WLR42737.1 FixH family protein [Bacillus carboniphilus]